MLPQPRNLATVLQSRHGIITALNCLVTALRRGHDSATSPRTCSFATLQRVATVPIGSSQPTALLPCYVASSRRHGFNCLVTALLRRHRLKQPLQSCHGLATCRHGFNCLVATCNVATVSQPQPRPRYVAMTLQLRHKLAASLRFRYNFVTASQRCHDPATWLRIRNTGTVSTVVTALSLSSLATILQPRYSLATVLQPLQPRYGSSCFATNWTRFCSLGHDFVTSPRFCNLATALQPCRDSATSKWSRHVPPRSLSQFCNLGYNFATSPRFHLPCCGFGHGFTTLQRLAATLQPCNGLAILLRPRNNLATALQPRHNLVTSSITSATSSLCYYDIIALPCYPLNQLSVILIYSLELPLS
ncbi:hypothetical protein GGR50DRAFT_699029 [Xylaria sp. CBS 124048]|nr:hypothetical protein GGR50DRAFT_699029 [Xylaria sp. CBS 124048]